MNLNIENNLERGAQELFNEKEKQMEYLTELKI